MMIHETIAHARMKRASIACSEEAFSDRHLNQIRCIHLYMHAALAVVLHLLRIVGDVAVAGWTCGHLPDCIAGG